MMYVCSKGVCCGSLCVHVRLRVCVLVFVSGCVGVCVLHMFVYYVCVCAA